MLTWLNYALLPLVARVCLVGMFPFSAWDKIVHWDAAMDQAKTSPIPGPQFLLILGILVEFLTPICIIIGWHDRLAAFILAGFCAVTALLYHPFWKFKNFWSPDESIGRGHFWDFLKNFGLAGGLLLVIIGGAPVSAITVLTHPLSTTPMGQP
jgi:putative oxidoreductase